MYLIYTIINSVDTTWFCKDLATARARVLEAMMANGRTIPWNHAKHFTDNIEPATKNYQGKWTGVVGGDINIYAMDISTLSEERINQLKTQYHVIEEEI